MASGFIQVEPDSTGKQIQTFENTIGGEDVHAQASVLTDSSGAEKTSFTVTGTVNVGNFPITQPVSGTVNVGNFPANQTVAGTVTANQGGTWYIQSLNSSVTTIQPNASNFLATVSGTVAATQSGDWTVKSSNASNFLSTVAGTVTAIQSNASNFLTTVSGTVSTNTNLSLIAGTTTATNSGLSTAGTQRVVIATDQPALTNKLLVTPDANTSFNLGQVGGSAVSSAGAGIQRVGIAGSTGANYVESVTGIQDVMPRKRTASTGLAPSYISGRINTSTTTTIVAATCYLSSLHICCVNSGAAWSMKVQDGQAVPIVFIPNCILNNIVTGSNNPLFAYSFAEPILFTSGINVVTVGGAAGNVDYRATYWQ